MDSKLAATYEEFEPLCKWQREEGRDTLVLHLQGTIIFTQFCDSHLNLTLYFIHITTKYTNSVACIF